VTDQHARFRAGLFFGLGAYLIWGVLPLYFKALVHVDPIQVVAHRVLWSLILLGGMITVLHRWPAFREVFRNPKLLLILGATSLLIAVNWLVYIWAVVNGHVLEGSLGYYLNPLANVLLGVVLLKERLTRLQTIAVALASVGVAVLAIAAGGGLWISFALAGSFALYGFLRKIAPVDALEGLSVETLLLAPVALGWLLWTGHKGDASMGADLTTDILLILSGAVTAIPLLLFTGAARRLPYSTLGFLQYIAPSIQFLLAVLLFEERFTVAHMICFGAIWSALALVGADGVRANRARSRTRKKERLAAK
jgi:chloramphenicol-sensitive protein RarD